MKIFIDAGHNYNGADTGAQGNGLREQDITFIISKRLKALLEADGHSVKMSRNNLTDNVGSTVSESINKRAKMSNDWDADLFVSIHCNAGGGKGTETLVYSLSGSAYNYAQNIQKSIVNTLNMVDRGIKKRTDLGVLRMTKSPAVLVETAFIDNVSDAQKLSYESELFANAIYEGIVGKKANTKPVYIKEITEINDIVWELAERGIISNKELWLSKLSKDTNSYWLAHKALHFIRSNDL